MIDKHSMTKVRHETVMSIVMDSQCLTGSMRVSHGREDISLSMQRANINAECV